MAYAYIQCCGVEARLTKSQVYVVALSDTAEFATTKWMFTLSYKSR